MRGYLTQEQVLLVGVTVLCLIALTLPKVLGPVWSFILSALKLRVRSTSKVVVGPIQISDEARLRHTHIVGATGSGKTVLIEQLLYQDLARGGGALVIDPKGDRELYDRLKAFCKKIGRSPDLHILSATHLTESVRWNPCRIGDVSEL